MKFVLVFVMYTAVLVAKKTRLRDEQDWSLESREDSLELVDVSKGSETIDFTGTLKRSFALHVALTNPENSIVCSPISALLPLGKLVLGTSRGTGRDELLTAIGIPKTKIKRRFKSLLKHLVYLPGVKLSIASRIYVSHKLQLSKKYEHLTKSVFHSSVEQLDFSSHTAVHEINKWVSDQTRGMIQEIYKPMDILPSDSVVLVNAVYFLGDWEVPFQKATMGDFHSHHWVRKIPMMKQTGLYNYVHSHTLGAQIIDIPYIKGKASFMIVLPDAKNGLNLLLRQLKVAPDILNEEISAMSKSHIQIIMPKFQVQTELNLKELYSKIGVNQIFSSKSGITRIVRDKDLQVTKAIQRCVLDVSEIGTEGAAVSSLDIVPVSLPMKFLADRPFLFFVRARQEQLFAGIFAG